MAPSEVARATRASSPAPRKSASGAAAEVCKDENAPANLKAAKVEATAPSSKPAQEAKPSAAKAARGSRAKLLVLFAVVAAAAAAAAAVALEPKLQATVQQQAAVVVDLVQQAAQNAMPLLEKAAKSIRSVPPQAAAAAVAPAFVAGAGLLVLRFKEAKAKSQ